MGTTNYWESAPVEAIQLTYLFLNKRDEIERIYQDIHLLDIPGQFGLTDWNKITKKNPQQIVSLVMQFNMTLSEKDVIPFIKRDMPAISSFLMPVTAHQAISFGPTIRAFQDMNELIVVFSERPITKSVASKWTRKIQYLVERRQTRRRNKPRK